MSDSDTTVLEQYRLARDKLIAEIIAGTSVVRLMIRGREVETSDPQRTLEFVEREIEKYERRTASNRGRTSTLVRRKRD